MMVVVFNLWQLVLKSGPMIWPILLLSMVALAVGLERMFALSSLDREIKEHKALLMRFLQQESIKQTVGFCESNPSPLTRMVKAGLLRFGNSAPILEAAMNEIFIYEKFRLHERIGILAFIINVSVLMGLLGTAIGLTVTFNNVHIRSNVFNNPLSVGDFSAGVWQALLSTVAGLVVCIFSFTVYSYCTARINNFILELDINKSYFTHVLVQMVELNPDES